MSTSIPLFWKLIVDSQLLKPKECRKLAEEFTQQVGGSEKASDALAEWLVKKGAISQYQANVLLAGQAGPFVYGDYKIYDRIESGRLTGIFRALHIGSRHKVCLMFLTGPELQDPQAVQRVAQQASAANRASAGHPHLFRCYQLVDLGTFKFLVTEDIQGKRVERVLDKQGALPVSEACRIARHAALGLARLHAMGVMHGEIRPTNLWLDPQKKVKLFHFPLARDPLAPPRPIGPWLAEPGQKAPAEADYVAPEVAHGAAPDARSDVYSLGCTLYQMLTNRVPFAGKDGQPCDLRTKLAMHANDAATPLERINPSIPPGLAKVVSYMMQKSPDLRYQQASSVVEALLPYLKPGDEQSPQPVTTPKSQAYEAWLVNPHAPKSRGASYEEKATATVGAIETVAAPVPAPAPTPVASQAPVAPSMPAAPPPSSYSPMGAASGQSVPMAGAMPGTMDPYAMQGYGGPAVAMAPVYAGSATSTYSGQAVAAAPVAPGSAPSVQGEAKLPVVSGADASRPAALRGRKKKNSEHVFLLATGGIAAVLIIGILVWINQAEDKTAPPVNKGSGTQVATISPNLPVTSNAKPPVKPAVMPPAVGKTPPPVAPPPPSVREPTAIDGQSWPSPTVGKPLDLRYLAPGAEVIVALRPADIMANPESAYLLEPNASGDVAAMGAWGQWFKQELPKLAATGLDNVEQVLIEMIADPSGASQVAYVIRTKTAVAEADLLAAWGNPTATPLQDFENKDYPCFVSGERAYYVPEAEQGRLLVIAPLAAMRDDIVKTKGKEPVPPLAVAALLKSSDTDRHVTVAIAPDRLLGKNALAGILAVLQSPLETFLSVNADVPKGAMLSCHLSDTFFAELRIYNSFEGASSTAVAKDLHGRVQAMPEQINNYMFDMGRDMSPASKPLLKDFTKVMGALAKWTYAATQDDQVVLRASLPPRAAQWLAMDTFLALLESTEGSAGGDTVAVATPQGGGPLTVADKLGKKTSLTFDRNTLEISMKLLGEDMGVEIAILGSDLQLEGITKNQSFGLMEENKPAREILKTIMAKANPDGKLIYVIKPKEPGGEDIIFITTRQAAATRKDKLPPELVDPNSTKAKK